MVKHANEIMEIILQKPESTRKIIAVAVVLCLMIIIVGIWWTTFSIKPTSMATENTNRAMASSFSIFK
ncbi:MAG: hypothetical protein AAB795_01210 [Patescibacteria group bacterium]